MTVSNLPPGCSSADGGIDHEYETALDELCEVVNGAHILRLLAKIAPAITEAYSQGFKDGWEDGKLTVLEGR